MHTVERVPVSENLPAQVECLIPAVKPYEEANMTWNTEREPPTHYYADSVVPTLNPDGKTYSAVFGTKLIFSRDDNGRTVTCCAVWKGSGTDTCNATTYEVYCEYCVQANVTEHQ